MLLVAYHTELPLIISLLESQEVEESSLKASTLKL